MAKVLKSTDQNYVEVQADLVHETDDAYLINDGDREAWIPKSLVEDFEFTNGKNCNIIIPQWLAEKKELV